MTTAKHSSATTEWHSRPGFLCRVRDVLGRIDVDPASCAGANETVRAARYITAAENGLTAEWMTEPSTVFMNPPGGKLKGRSMALLFWERLMLYRAAGMVTHAVVLAFNADLLQVSQTGMWPSLGDFLLCVPSSRMRFDCPGNAKADSPTHNQAIAYVPGLESHPGRFISAMAGLGILLEPLGGLRGGQLGLFGRQP